MNDKKKSLMTLKVNQRQHLKYISQPIPIEKESRGQAVLGRQIGNSTPWLSERHDYQKK